jgi:hypothetical protein
LKTVEKRQRGSGIGEEKAFHVLVVYAGRRWESLLKIVSKA